ncbi:hypothetical protein T4B_13285 [Trichinella pseudospiralis]|uniref:Uncharacterized protein n=1 Tax=Trichinella pseudospiralis TaxID=6337 RepID=A0A0V1ELK3_TRIPS|nr:hypothetical protein T4A_49 [Trichinella pseudospiralis]KRZ26174.1 hypothetical protein T4B_13285 [Trichinella pseudospiralis]KRZ36114.1 hypothetical protein T4C_9954 [Trichinella pseudospiralis]
MILFVPLNHNTYCIKLLTKLLYFYGYALILPYQYTVRGIGLKHEHGAILEGIRQLFTVFSKKMQASYCMQFLLVVTVMN